MQPVVEAPTYSSDYGDLPIIESAIVYNEEADEVRVFVLNNDQEDDTAMKIDLQGYGDLKIKQHLVLNGDDLDAINTIEEPENVQMEAINVSAYADNTVVLPKLSWNVILLG